MFAAGCLCISTGYFSASALSAKDRLNGRTSDFVYLQNGVHEFINTENFFGNYGYDEKATQIYVPGDTITGSVEVGNDHTDTVNIYLYAANAGDDKYQAYAAVNADNTDYNWQQLKAISGKLISQITLTVRYKPQGAAAETVVYSGLMDGSNGMNTVNAIDLGEYATGDRGTLSFELKIPKEDLSSAAFTVNGTQLNRGYNGAVAMIDWVFTCSQIEPPVSSEPTTTTTTTTTKYVTPTDTPKPKPIPVPGTGEEAIPYIIGAVICGISALAIILVVFRGKKETDD